MHKHVHALPHSLSQMHKENAARAITYMFTYITTCTDTSTFTRCTKNKSSYTDTITLECWLIQTTQKHEFSIPRSTTTCSDIRSTHIYTRVQLCTYRCTHAFKGICTQGRNYMHTRPCTANKINTCKYSTTNLKYTRCGSTGKYLHTSLLICNST